MLTPGIINGDLPVGVRLRASSNAPFRGLTCDETMLRHIRHPIGKNTASLKN